MEYAFAGTGLQKAPGVDGPLDCRLVYGICWDFRERREKVAGLLSDVFPLVQGLGG